MQKRTRKIIMLLAVVMLMIVCFVFGASALEPTGQCGDNVYWSFDESTGELVISGEGDMANYSAYYSPFFNSNIKSVILEDGVESIGNYVFWKCESLTDVVMGNGVINVGKYAFEECINLENIIIGNSVKTIEENAFDRCFNLTSINIPDSVETIASRAFLYCKNLKSLTIPNSVTSIGESSFADCVSLESVVLPDSITTIERSTFSQCYILSSITLPENVTAIYESAFFNCNELESINLPENLKIIERGAFYGCESLKHVIIPSSVQTIEDEVFYGCDSLESVSIPNNITSIGHRAFANCDKLEKIYVSEGVKKIDTEAFYGCQNLKTITVDKNNTEYYSDEYGVLFNKDKTELIMYPVGNERKNYTVPDSVEKVVKWAFNIGCVSVVDIELSENIKEIEAMAFYACLGAFDRIYINEKVEYIGEGAFAMLPFCDKIYIEGLSTDIQPYALGYSEWVISGISQEEFVEKYQTYLQTNDKEIEKELEKYISYPDEPVFIGTIYCHAGSTAEAYAIANGMDYELIHFFKGEWTYDYNNMVRTRKCIHCDELETEKLETTESGDVEIIEPEDPDTDFEVDEIAGDKFLVVEETVTNGIEGNAEVLRAFDITLKNKDGVHVQPDGTVKVKLPLDWTKDGIYKVYRVNDDGTLTDMNAYRQGSHMVFETDHFSIYVIVDVSEKSEADEPETPDTPDVPAEPDTSDCSCICHKEGWFFEMLTIVFRFVTKLLGVLPTCDCGIAHY